MPSRNSKPTDSNHEWADLLAEYINVPLAPVGEGWKTAKQIANDPDLNNNGRSVDAVRRQLIRLLEKGLVETVKVRTRNGLANYYRPKKS